MSGELFAYIAVMAIVTFAIRALPLTLIRREIKNRRVRAFLLYIPYATLTAMTFPAIISATRSPISGCAALITSLSLAIAGRSLFVVSISGVIAVFVAELFV